MAEQQENFFFDDYSVDENAGVPVTIPINGRPVPFTLRRALTIKQRSRATEPAIKIKIVDGKPEVGKLDMDAFSIGVAIEAIIAWPFTYRDGKPVPVTRETVSKLPAEAVDLIAAYVLGKEKEQEAALVPFEMESVAVS